MPKVNEGFLSIKIGLAKGEHLNFSSLETHSIGKGKAKNSGRGPKDHVLPSKTDSLNPKSKILYAILYSASFSLAWAAASLAIGTLGGEQET